MHTHPHLNTHTPTTPNTDKEESVEQFIRRNLGDEVFERLIEPFCSGVYAGDPSKLSMQAAFQKVIRGGCGWVGGWVEEGSTSQEPLCNRGQSYQQQQCMASCRPRIGPTGSTLEPQLHPPLTLTIFTPSPTPHSNTQQIWILEKNGGSLVGGALQLMKERKANPPPPRDPRLPPKPKGQTVGSFKTGLRTLTDAIGNKLQGEQQW